MSDLLRRFVCSVSAKGGSSRSGPHVICSCWRACASDALTSPRWMSLRYWSGFGISHKKAPVRHLQVCGCMNKLRSHRFALLSCKEHPAVREHALSTSPRVSGVHKHGSRAMQERSYSSRMQQMLLLLAVTVPPSIHHLSSSHGRHPYPGWPAARATSSIRASAYATPSA